VKDFAKSFYTSRAWKNCRRAYAASVGGLCEDCKAKGLITPGEIVHHKTELTPENINDPAVTLSWSNLRLVCRECHARKHGARERRYTVDPLGRVIGI
jgi:5-methylcytosine-specific restriction endonuclease McrA